MTNRQKAGFIVGEIAGMCGYVGGQLIDRIAGALDKLDQLPSPWEYQSVPIFTNHETNDANMNALAAGGWELHCVASGWQFWRRRKGVSDGETSNNAG